MNTDTRLSLSLFARGFVSWRPAAHYSTRKIALIGRLFNVPLGGTGVSFSRAEILRIFNKKDKRNLSQVLDPVDEAFIFNTDSKPYILWKKLPSDLKIPLDSIVRLLQIQVILWSSFLFIYERCNGCSYTWRGDRVEHRISYLERDSPLLGFPRGNNRLLSLRDVLP